MGQHIHDLKLIMTVSQVHPSKYESVRRPGFPSRTSGETSEAAIVMKKLLSTYKQKCKEGGGDPGQELIKAMEKQLDGENIMNKVVYLKTKVIWVNCFVTT